MSRFQSRTGERLHWRAIVSTTGLLDPSRSSRGLAWHLVECADPTDSNAHCAVGQHMLSTGRDPEGHCLIDGTCPRCALASGPIPSPTATATAETPAATSSDDLGVQTLDH